MSWSDFYTGFDRYVTGGYLPGGDQPMHEGGGIPGVISRNAPTLWNEYSGKSAAREAARFNAAEAQKNRDFQQMMSSTAHQRAVADLKKAGLNPILAAGVHGAASTPAGSSASSTPAQTQGPMLDIFRVMPQVFQSMASAVQSLSSAKQADSQSDLNNTVADNIRALQPHEIAVKEGQVAVSAAEVNKINAMIGDISASADQKRKMIEEIQSRINKLNHETRSAKSQADVAQAVAEFQTGVGGDIQRWTDAVGLKGRDLIQLGNMVGYLMSIFKGSGKLVITKPE